MRSFRPAAMALLAATLLPFAAQAHTGADAAGHHAFVAGLLHPLTGPDHLAAMFCVGLWSALVAPRGGLELLRAPLGFAALLLVGALAGMAGVAWPGVEPMIAVSLLALGLLVATRQRLPALAGTALVGGFALFHGLAHGTELRGHAAAASTMAGMLCATALLHAAGLAAGWQLRARSAWLARGAGAAVALLGLGLLGAAA